MDKVEGYRRLVERYGEEDVASAILAKWLSDPAGDVGFDRLAAMIRLYDAGARLKHFRDEDMAYETAPDDYYRKGDSRSEAARKREQRRR